MQPTFILYPILLHEEGFAVDYITVEEAAAVTGLAKCTLYSKASRREIPSYRIGRSLRFKRSELLRLFKARPALRPLATPEDPRDGEGVAR